MPENHQLDRLLSRPLSRRGFVQAGLAAAGLGAALAGAGCGRDQVYAADYPVVPENQVQFPPNGKSVLILGGGFAGLHAACDLADRGFKVTVIEKTNLLGGKLKSWREKDFGVRPTGDPGWRGYPRDHGLHAVWGSYNNLREFMGRHGYRLWKFPDESTIYNYVCRDGASFQLGQKASWPGYLGRAQSLFQTNRALATIAGPDTARMRSALLRMASFDYDDVKQRMFLDGLSFPQWARAVGMPAAALDRLFSANAHMSMMDELDRTSALAMLTLSASVSGHPDDMRVDTFMSPVSETYIEPLAAYLRERGGETIPNTEVLRVNREGNRIQSVAAGDLSAASGPAAKIWKCDVCGTVYYSPTPPARCSVCGAKAAQIPSYTPRPARDYTADYYILAMDLPGARQIIASSGLLTDAYFNRVLGLHETAVYPVTIWYDDANSWKKRFPGSADFFASGFKHLGITINLAHDGVLEGKRVAEPLVPEYQNQGLCVIETQIAGAERLETMTDEMIARLVHAELSIVMPGLPAPRDYYVNRWNNYSPQRVGDEALRPTVESPLENLFLIGDWVRTDHLSNYMEKAYVAAKLATNLCLDRAGQNQGRMTILPSGTPSAIIGMCRGLFSVYT